MQINVTWDTSVLTSPVVTQFEAAVNYVVNLYDNLFTNPVTINIDVGWGEVGGQTLSTNALGESISNLATYSYNTIRNALTSTANASGDPAQLAAVSTLPSSNPTPHGRGNNITIATAEAKALGLISGSSTRVDGYVGFAADQTVWSFSPTATPTQIEYYFIGVAEHEISEVMGRFSDIGQIPGHYSVLDLFRYSAPNARDLSASQGGSNTTAYFSIDSGTTNLGTWNNTSGNGDLGDWYPSGPAPGGNDAFNDYSTPGAINKLSPSDVTLMNVLGWTTTSCFMPGTMIRTPNGDLVVEKLKRGDPVFTTEGRVLPVSWIGRQTVSTRFADPLRVLPIRIKAGAIAENVPSRDLLLSPDHAVLIDGALIQAGALVNGTSIVREEDVPATFTYYHVELDDHSLILAENTPAETFIDNVDRLNFDNWTEHQELYPQGKSINELPYPRAKAYRQVRMAIRVKLSERATTLSITSGVAAA